LILNKNQILTEIFLINLLVSKLNHITLKEYIKNVLVYHDDKQLIRHELSPKESDLSEISLIRNRKSREINLFKRKIF
jgi:hypothetical protein